jgi:hypothetical protein
MTALSMKEEELAEREGEIFNLKLRVEEKEKTILQLMVQGESAKEEIIRNMGSSRK